MSRDFEQAVYLNNVSYHYKYASVKHVEHATGLFNQMAY